MIGIALSMASNPSQITVIQQAIAVLRRFGQDAHIYLPGVGMLNGLQAANYLDSAGTTVGTVDQPVGLALDAAGSLGVELVSAASSWTTFGTATGTAINTATASIVFNGAAANYSGVVVRATNSTIGATCLVTFTVSGYVSGQVQVGYGVSSGYVSANGTYSYYLKADSAAVATIQVGIPSLNATVSNISVREVTGIAASQPTTASKPILRRGAVNLQQRSGDLTQWQSTAAGVITTGQPDPLGGATAQTLTGAGKNVYLTGSAPAAGVYTFAFTLNSPAAGTLSLGGASGVGVMDVVSVSAGWGTYAVTKTVPVTDGCAIILNGTLSAITFYRAALFQGTYTASQIQALGGIPLTTTAPVSTALGPQYWSFDGSNDSLALGSVPFQMSDDHWVVAGASSTVASQERTIFSVSGAATNNPLCPIVVFGSDNRYKAYWRNDAGVLDQAGQNGTVHTLGTAHIVSALKVGNNKTLRVDGVVQSGAGGTNLGASTLTAANVGAYVNTVGALAGNLQGNIYPLAFGKGTMTEADLLLIEKMLGQIAGVQI